MSKDSPNAGPKGRHLHDCDGYGITSTKSGSHRGIDTSGFFGDSPSIDAFARLRVSNPETIFDSKQIFDNQPLFWDDAETSGSGTSSTHSVDEASTTIAVSASTAGTRVRQTFQRFNYQPGKSQLILLTGVLGTAESGITQRMGYYDDDNGLIFDCIDGVMYVTRRTNVTGSVVDNSVAQSSWNLDTMDGNGPSGITLDFAKTNIFLIDFEWLGVGRVRMGFVVDGIPVYCHEFLNANNLTEVYMSTPNLPLRYEISNDGTGGASDVVHICTSVISEGGREQNGILRYTSSAGTALTTGVSGSVWAAIGIRLKTTALAATILIENVSILATTSDNFEWQLLLNPTVAGTFTYVDQTNSSVQTVLGVTANTITGGTPIAGGWAAAASPINDKILNARTLGAAIDGTRDEIVLGVRPLTNNAAIQSSMTWRELS